MGAQDKRRPRLLILSRYGRKGPSSRLRYLDYLPYLEAEGFSVRWHGFFSDAYLDLAYSGRRRLAALLGLLAYLPRLGWLPAAFRADIVWIEKEMFPWVPAWAERALTRAGVRLVSDYDDAWYLRYRGHQTPRLAARFPDKIEQVMTTSSLVMAGNPVIETHARKAGARSIMLVPTVLDAERYVTRRHQAVEAVRIAWIGTAFNSAYLTEIAPALADAAARCAIELVIIGGAGIDLPGVPIRYMDWSEATEADELARCDIGVMPLRDTQWDRGKCAFKLLQYMAAGLPVLASPVGVNVEIATAEVGFLPRSQAEWADALVRLAGDPQLRASLGAAGRRKIEQDYSLRVWGPKVSRALMDQIEFTRAR